jgi:hypothetical protein
MFNRRRTFACVVLAITHGAWNANDAWAELGGAHTAPPPVGGKLSQQALFASAYEVWESTTAQGATLREYVTPGGVVFAVGWSGPAHPDLKGLLGRYYWTYLTEATRSRGSAKVLSIYSSELVLQIVRLPRGVTGLAYLPQLLPTGAGIENLR